MIRLICYVLLVMVCGCSGNHPDVLAGLHPNNILASLVGNGKIYGNSYVVRKGDTLHAIAWRANVDYQEIAKLNNISPPYTIYPGRRLLLTSARDNATLAVPITKLNAEPARSNNYGAAKINNPIYRQSSNRNYQPISKNNRQYSSANSAASKPQARNRTTKPGNNTFHNSAIKHGVKTSWIWPVKGPIVNKFASGKLKQNGIEIGGNKGTLVLASSAGTVVYSGNGLRGYGNLIIIKHENNFLSAYAHNSENVVKEGEAVKLGQLIAKMGDTGTNRVMLHFEIRHNGKPVDPLMLLPRK